MDVVVHFGNLEGLTSLPIKRLREQFRYEVVLTVLPVHSERARRETLLVATPTMLALLTAVPFPRGHWMTQWAPWDAVDVVEGTGPTADGVGGDRSDILVHGRRFRPRLAGEIGHRAMRDFVVVARDRRQAMPSMRAR